MRFVGLFTSSPISLVIAARIPSVIAGIGLVLACNGIGHRLFSSRGAGLALAAFVGGLPQIAFLCAYHNNDAPSLFASALIVYSWLLGRDKEWSLSSCIILGTAIGVCALTYYFAFGFILASIPIYFYSQAIRVKRKECPAHEVWARAAAILITALIVGGWFYLRMAILYSGDLFGRAITSAMKNAYGSTKLHNGSGYTLKESGATLMDMLFVIQHRFGLTWVTSTAQSFVGRLGYMTYSIGSRCYVVYASYLLTALIGLVATIKGRETRPAIIAALLASLMAISVSIIYSYTNDYQAQGRYIITFAIPLGIAVVGGLRAIDSVIEQQARLLPSIPNGIATTIALGAYLVLLTLVITNVYIPLQFRGLLSGFKYWWPYWH